MSDAPERIVAMATRDGTFWKAVQPSPWFGEAFKGVEYTRVNQWVSVKEPPEVGTRVLAALHGDAERMDVITWDEDSGEWGYSHWLPLTALPSAP